MAPTTEGAGAPPWAGTSGKQGSPTELAVGLVPTGTVTFLLTDIQGSTRLLQEAGASYADLLETHRRLLRGAFAANRGREVNTEGDSFFVVFPSAADAVAAAAEAQRSLAAHPWPEGRRVLVRMGLHSGEAFEIAGDYVVRRADGVGVARAPVAMHNAGLGGQLHSQPMFPSSPARTTPRS